VYLLHRHREAEIKLLLRMITSPRDRACQSLYRTSENTYGNNVNPRPTLAFY